jgi:chemotaxis protein MotB
MEQKSAPIIVIRKKGGHGGHHGGAWKVAYADFVTAMMALFIVLWLLSSSERTRKAVGGYFQDPTGSGKQTGNTLAGAGEGIVVKQDDMDKLKEKLDQAMKQIPKFHEMKDQVVMTITGEGLRIEMLEKEGGMFFESGNAHPSVSGRQLLASLAAEIGRLPNRLVIEGHTDSKPFVSSNGYSNWELSADRANSSRRLMEEAGLRPNQAVQVRGFADQNLRMPNQPENPSNRRISVIIKYQTDPAAAKKDGGKKEGEPGAERSSAKKESGGRKAESSPAAHQALKPEGSAKKGH